MQFLNQFRRSKDHIPLNNAGLCLMTQACKNATIEILEQATTNPVGNLDLWINHYQKSREIFASLVGCQPLELAFTHGCATAISQAAFGLELKKGEEILSWEGEYPSNSYPWIAKAKNCGALYTALKPVEGYRFDTDLLIANIRPKTKIVAVSWVQYLNGWTLDLKKISQACRANGSYLVVDAIQGLGVMPFNMQELDIDIVCGGAHKWLCGPLGLGFIAVKKSLIAKLEPLIKGAQAYTNYDELVTDPLRPAHPDFRRFESSAPHMLMAYGAAKSVEKILETGVETVGSLSSNFANELSNGLMERGCQILSSTDSYPKSPIVTFQAKSKSQNEIAQSLSAKGISFSLRLGGIRLAPYIYNTKEDFNKVFECL